MYQQYRSLIILFRTEQQFYMKDIDRYEPIDRNKAQSLQKLYQNLESYHQPVSRIFQPPSFLFANRDEEPHHIIHKQQRISHGTIHGFRPTFDKKDKRQLSGGKRFRVKENYQRVNRAKKILNQHLHMQKKLDKLIQKQVNNFRESHRVFINPNKKQLKKEIMNTEQINKSLDKDEQGDTQVSPYAKYSINTFPKKQLRTMITKQKSLYPGRDDLALKLKSTLRQKIDQMQGKMRESSSQANKMLQIMTIYSIKEKALPKNSFFQKKQQQKMYQLREKSQHFNESRSQQKDPNEVDLIKRNISYQKVYYKRIYSYMSFLSKVNYSNNIPIRNYQLSEKVSNTKIQVFVGNGNNRYLLLALLKRRFWLQVTNKITSDTKFVWTQNSIKQVHSSQKSYNQYLLSQAQKTNKQTKCKIDRSGIKIKINTMNKLDADESMVVVQKSTYHSANLLQPTTEDSLSAPKKHSKGKTLTKASQYNKKLFLSVEKAQKVQLYLKTLKIRIKKEVQHASVQNMEMITNHVPHNSFIGSKKALFYTMQHYYRNIKKIDPFTIIPKTYHFKSADDESYTAFLQKQKQQCQKSIWIVKPGECSNRGTGISIIRAAQVTRKLLKKQFHQNGQTKTTIIQSYITDPLLYNGRKFDIRHYMMVSIVNGNLKAYWYSQGYIRTSSEFFTLQDLNNPYIHLTNDAIQKYSEHYGKYEPGNKLSYHELQRYLDHHFEKPSIDFKNEILSQMKEIATDVIKANYKRIDKERRLNNFELFGLDFMIDRKFKPWLIQVNTNPCLQISCPLHSRIIPLLLEHTLRLGLDPLIPPPSHYPPNEKYYLSDNFIEKLRYQIIFDELEYRQQEINIMPLQYSFDFDEPEDQYQNDGAEIDLAKILD